MLYKPKTYFIRSSGISERERESQMKRTDLRKNGRCAEDFKRKLVFKMVLEGGRYFQRISLCLKEREKLVRIQNFQAENKT